MDGGRSDNISTLLGEPRRAILSMAFPVLIALLIAQVNTFVDSIWCSSLGIGALSAINLVSPLYYVVVGIGSGIGIGVNAAVSRHIGAGDREGAERCSSQTLLLMAAVTLPLIPVLFLVMDPLISLMGGSDILEETHQYLLPIVLLCPFAVLNGIIAGMLRGEGAARLSTVVNVVSAVTNMVLDPVLIFGLGMGLPGASVATMCSSVVAVGLGLYAYLSGTTYLGLHFSRPRREVLRDVMSVGIPQTLELNIMSVMNLFLISFVVACGGTEGLATYATPWRLIGLSMVPANALAAAMVPVCSSAIGQRDRERLKSGYWFTIRVSFLLGVAMMFLIWVSADLFMYAFTYAEGMTGYHDGMVHALRIYVLMLPFYGMIYVGSSALSSLQKSGYALLSSFLRNLMLIGIYFVATFHDMEWIYWGLTIGEIIGGLFMLALAHWQIRLRYRSMPAVQATV